MVPARPPLLRSNLLLLLVLLALAGSAAGCATPSRSTDASVPAREAATAEEKGEEKPEAARPNLLFIVTDDQAPRAWGRSPQSYPDVRTPHMDRIAEEGSYLPNAFVVTPVCSPSRASLLASRYGTELGITDFILPDSERGLPPETVTWAEQLQEAGYATGLVGKWHLGSQDRHAPTRHGYDYFFGFRIGRTSLKNPTLEENGQRQTYEGFTTNILTDRALRFIKRRQEESAPFALSLHYRAPHAPWLPLPEQDWTPFENLDPQIPNPDYPGLKTDELKQQTRRYLASVASVDRNVGRLLDALDRRGLAENTVVVFTSDHGYNLGERGIWHKGNGVWIVEDPPPATENIPARWRPNMFDRSLRVPVAVRWPGRIAPGTVVEETITFLDWYPTILDLAGVGAPPDSARVRGRSFLPLLKGGSLPGWKEDFYAQYSMHHQARAYMRSYRTEAWKLVRDLLNPERSELYHLAEDPEERVNLIDSTAPQARAARERLNERLIERMSAVGDTLLRRAERQPVRRPARQQ